MTKQIVLLLCALLACSTADLAEEAEQQLQELFSLIQGEISVAHSTLDDLSIAFATDSLSVYEDAQINLQQEYETIESQLNTVVDLAVSAGYDVSRCTNYREDTLQRLPERYGLEIYQCIAGVLLEMTSLVYDATYVIDIIMTKVHNFEQQLRSCRGDILCISPLVTEMALHKISLVQDIEKEVQTTESQLALLRVGVDTCYDTNMASFVAQANSILGDITACIDRILG